MSAEPTNESDWGYLEANIAYNQLSMHVRAHHGDCGDCADIRWANDPEPPDFPAREAARERLRHGNQFLKGVGAVIPEGGTQ